MKTKYLGFLLLLGFFLLGSYLPAQAITTLTWSASGIGRDNQTISASATFLIGDEITHTFIATEGSVPALQIILTNTADTTGLRPNLLTGIFFGLEGVGALPTDTAGFDGTATVFYDPNDLTKTRTEDIAPAYKYTYPNPDPPPPNLTDTINAGKYMSVYQASGFGEDSDTGVDYSNYNYAIATVAYGLPGLNGSLVGDDNYGILGGAGVPSGNVITAIPVVQNYATFWIRRPDTLVDLAQLTDLRFTYGSKPDYHIDYIPPNVIPEPSSLLLVGLGLSGLAWFARQRRRQ